MARWWGIVLIAAGGCNQLLGIKPVTPTAKCAADDDDCDMIPDGLDLCPADPDDGSDGDGDGVGDACDPSPSLPGDSIAAFYSMQTDDPQWTSAGGAWTFDHSALVQTAVVDGSVKHPAPTNIEPTIEVVVEPTFALDGSSVWVYGLVQPSNLYLVCRVVHHDTGDVLELLYGGNLTTLTLAQSTGPLTTGTQLRLYLGQLPDANHSVRCRAHYDTVGVEVGLDPVLSRTLGRASFASISLETQQASAAFDSVTVYTRQP
jgi:hypothetical protein